jgi:hypothetical protein
VNFGVVLVGSPVTKKISVYNEGGMEGSFRFVYDETLPLKIHPSSGVLGPRGSPTSKATISV